MAVNTGFGRPINLIAILIMDYRLPVCLCVDVFVNTRMHRVGILKFEHNIWDIPGIQHTPHIQHIGRIRIYWTICTLGNGEKIRPRSSSLHDFEIVPD